MRVFAYGCILLCNQLLSLEPRVFKAVRYAVCFPNAGSLPLLFFESLCGQSVLNRAYGGNQSLCFQSATGMIFVYLISWHLWFYVWGFYKLGAFRVICCSNRCTWTCYPVSWLVDLAYGSNPGPICGMFDPMCM